MAILLNPEEKLPPSDPPQSKFIHAGKNLGINVEIIHPTDFMRIPGVRWLFIRETTSIDHHTLSIREKKGRAGGLVTDG